ncbi:MAG: response regulator transcription factor [Flavisolibacter sp.]|nr:response regulator transcription factor [Flavisolibacter sp.]
MNSPPLKVILADPHLSLQALANYLDKDSRFELQAAVENGGNLFLNLARPDPPDVVVTDIDMPDMDGIELCLRLDRDYPQLNKMIFTHNCEPYTIRQLLDTSILGLLSKKNSFEDFGCCVEAVGRGHLHIGSPYSEMQARFKKQPQLNKYQLKVLELLSQGYTTSQIAALTYKSEATVKLVKKSLYKISGTRNEVALGIWALDNGYVRVRR